MMAIRALREAGLVSSDGRDDYLTRETPTLRSAATSRKS